MHGNRSLQAVLLVVLVSTLALTGGCQIFKNPVMSFSDDGELLPNPVGDGLVVSPTPLIPDVPIPVGFKPVASKSSSAFNGQFRTVNHYYQGRAVRGQTYDFYRSYLPRNDWQFVGESAAEQWRTQTYTKGSEQLTLSVRHYNGVSSVDVRITGR